MANVDYITTMHSFTLENILIFPVFGLISDWKMVKEANKGGGANKSIMNGHTADMQQTSSWCFFPS